MEQHLLNFNEPLDIGLLDRVVAAMYQGSGDEQKMADKLLTKLKEHPQAWKRVDTILEHSKSDASKFFAFTILEDLVKFRWKILPTDQREGIKNYVSNLIIKLTSSPAVMKQNYVVVGRLNVVITQILKVDWPHHWKNFIPEIVSASQANESICENSVKILGMLSEEVFDFSKGQLTQQKILELKSTLNEEFFQIFSLFQHIMANSKNGELLLATLETMFKYLSWIPVIYIFETNLVEMLIKKFFPVDKFRNVALKCLTEVASLDAPENGEGKFADLYLATMMDVTRFMPPGTDLNVSYERGNENVQTFISDLAMFLTTFFSKHRSVLEVDGKPHYMDGLRVGHQYLVGISTVDDIEVFKIALEYWHSLAEFLYNEVPIVQSPLMLSTSTPAKTPRRMLYAPLLSQIRSIMIGRMAKPEEVLVVEDDSGHAVREPMKDGEAVERYHLMRETLVYLAHLDYDDTVGIMRDRLAAIMADETRLNWTNLNTLCWAVGSIAESQSEDAEKRFLVVIVRDLLTLCENRRGKDNKAIVAANIMYVVGQHPRFLRSHWKFLTTVINKLFEFMHEKHPGVQEMAVDTFLKLVKKCKSKFAERPEGEEFYLHQVIRNIGTIISDLEEDEIQGVYEGVGIMISVQPPEHQVELIDKLMGLPNMSWQDVMNKAKQNLQTLMAPEVQRKLAAILRANIRVCHAVGPAFINQLGNLYLDLLNLAKFFSQAVAVEVAKNPQAVKYSSVINAQAVKRETLKLITMFVKHAANNEVPIIVQNFLPPLLPNVLEDYRSNHPDARDREVLNLIAEIVSKCQGAVINHVPTMLDCVFEPTLQMIAGNFEDYPDIREGFYHFLNMVVQNCFEAILRMSAAQQKLVMQSVIWGFRHTMNTIAETSLIILATMIAMVGKLLDSHPDVANGFYQAYLMSFLTEILAVLTDTFHKSSLKQHCEIISLILRVAINPRVQPLWDTSRGQEPNMNNAVYVRDFLCNLLAKSFPNLNQQAIMGFVVGLFEKNTDEGTFKRHVRDFLVQVKEFNGGDDNARLYLEEEEKSKQQKEMVPGMIQPNDPRRENML